jgi:uncharacterized membrane protein YfcA
MPDFTGSQWVLAVVAAFGIGVSKAGFPGLALLHVIVFAFLFGARDSTGIVLPLLLVGDLGAIGGFYKHTRWEHVWRTLPPACVGVLAGALLMGRLSDSAFAPVLGWIILTLTILHLIRIQRADWTARVPRGRLVAWATGLLAGATTMLANAGGPIMTLYLLTMRLPKLEFTGTVAWFFFVINAFKVPFSIALGLIHTKTLLLNVLLIPGVLVGLLAGRWLIRRVSQRLFDALLLTFAAIAALRLIGLF